MDAGASGDLWENIKWIIGGLVVFFSSVVGVLWGFVLRVQSGLFAYSNTIKEANDTESERIWDMITRLNTKAHDDAIEQERRFATKQDVQNLTLHMDKGHADINTRLDGITQLIINRNNH